MHIRSVGGLEYKVNGAKVELSIVVCFDMIIFYILLGKRFEIFVHHPRFIVSGTRDIFTVLSCDHEHI